MGNTTQGWYSPTGSGSTPVLTELEIQNTLYVCVNGDDATALPNRLDKPFATIYGASLVANAGDVVYVFAGSYFEIMNDWVKSDVIYDFQEGSIVYNNISCITDSGIAKNIVIHGRGVFEVTNYFVSTGVIDITNLNTNIYVRCKSLLGVSNGINLLNNTNPYDIKCDYIFVSAQYGINLRGSANTGRIEFDRMLVTSGASPIIIRNANTDTTARTIYIKGRLIRTNNNAFGNGIIYLNNVFNTSVYAEINLIDHYSGGAGGIIKTDSGKLFVSNTNALGIGYGAYSSGSSVLYIENSYLFAPTYSLVTDSNASCKVVNSTLVAENPSITGGSVGVSGNGQLTAKNVVMVQKGASVNPCVLNLVTPANKVSLASCLLIGNSLNTQSIRNTAGLPCNVYIQEDCATNITTSGLVTNQVAGTNVVVDSDISRNTNNFFD